MDKSWAQLYHLQDQVLTEIQVVREDFYLTGGTALSRGYYQHRYSEDRRVNENVLEALGDSAAAWGHAALPRLEGKRWGPHRAALPAVTR